MKRATLTLLLAMSLCGCATDSHAPSFVAAPVPDPSSHDAILYVYRAHAVPMAWPAYLKIDDHEVASLSEEGFTWVYVTPGTHKLQHGWPALAGMPKVAFKRTFEPSKVYAFEMNGQLGYQNGFRSFSTRIREVAADDAKYLMNACCRYVAPSVEQ